MMKECYLNIYDGTHKELLNRINKSLKNKEKEFIVTANSEIFMASLANQTIEQFLINPKHIILADGISIVKTAKYFNIEIKQKIAGVELCEELLEKAENKKLNVYIYGSKQEVLNKLKNKYPKISFVGLKNGYDNKEEDIKKDILNKKPDLIIVALGVPRQELFINNVYKNSDKGIFIGVGGSLDVISGAKKRAPLLFRRLNMEWAYRLLCEPKRIKRFYDNNIKLLFVAKKYARKEGQNEN